jgi:hypothetical protein
LKENSAGNAGTRLLTAGFSALIVLQELRKGTLAVFKTEC